MYVMKITRGKQFGDHMGSGYEEIRFDLINGKYKEFLSYSIL